MSELEGSIYIIKVRKIGSISIYMQMAQSCLILKIAEEESQVVTMIPQRSSVPLISSAPPTSSWQSFPVFLLLVLHEMGQKYKLHIWLSYI